MIPSCSQRSAEVLLTQWTITSLTEDRKWMEAVDFYFVCESRTAEAPRRKWIQRESRENYNAGKAE